MERSVVARVRAEVTQAQRDMDSFAESTRKVGRAAEDASGRSSRASEKQASATKRVEQATSGLEQASRRQADAAGRVRVAETQLEEVRTKGTASASQMAAAQEKVEKARRDEAAATDGVTRAAREYESAMRDLNGQSSQAQSFAKQLAASAGENEQAWNTVGKGLAGVGAATTALGAAVLHTGISYNQLRQQSVAALTTMTGSAEAANQQMDELDAFASTSPFARDVFIRAQQQLLGFGTTAENVVPILDAIQNAVAAAGGSNQDIAELAQIIAQVGAIGKLTARDLQMFGYRGVDAARIIGQEMGYTGAQIREQITAGTLDADAAIKALVAGMTTEFDGAADNVKNTFAGAVDRVRAAWRDVSSIIAEPLVGREGGGLLVGALNELANAMRVFESLPDPLIQTGAAITGLAGLTLTAAGTVMVALPKWVAYRDSIEKLAEVHPRAASAIGQLTGTAGSLLKWGAALGVVTAAGVGLVRAFSDSGAVRGAEALRREIEDLAEAGQSLDSMQVGDFFQEMPTVFGQAVLKTQDLDVALRRVLNPTWNESISSMLGNIGIPSYMAASEEAVASLDAALTDMLNAGGQERPAALEMIEDLGLSSDELAKALPEASDAITELDAATGGAAGSLSELDSSLATSAEAMARYEANVEAAAEATREAEAAHKAWMEMVAASSAGFVDTQGTIADFYDGTIFKGREYLASLEDQVQAQRDWQENMLLLAGRVSEGVRDHLAEMGAEGAPLVAWLVDASEEELGRFEEVVGARSASAGEQMAAGLLAAGPLVRAASEQLSDEAIMAMVEGLTSGELTIAQAWESLANPDLDFSSVEAQIREMGQAVGGDWDPDAVTIPVRADTDTAIRDVDGLLVLMDGLSGAVTINGNIMPAETELQRMLWSIGQSHSEITINGDPISAELTLAGLVDLVNESGGVVEIDGANTQGVAVLEEMVRRINQSEGTVGVHAETRRAEIEAEGLLSYIGSQIATVGVDANTLAAERKIAALVARQRTVDIVANVIQRAIPGAATGGPIEGFAAGGAIRGPGTGTSDSIPAVGPSGRMLRVSNGEHIWTDMETRAVGGHGEMHRLRTMALSGSLRQMLDAVGHASGGPVKPVRDQGAWSPSHVWSDVPGTIPGLGGGGYGSAQWAASTTVVAPNVTVQSPDLRPQFEELGRVIAREVLVESRRAGSAAFMGATSSASTMLRDQAVSIR